MRGNKRLFIALLTACLISGLGFMLKGGGGGSKSPTIQSQHNPGVTEVMNAIPQKAPTKLLSVLFIGNSFTFYHNIPGMVVEIAKADPGNTIALDVQAVTQGAVSLEQLWQTGEGREVLKQRQWDYVVLQDNSAWALVAGNIAETTAATMKWTQEIRNAGGQPLLVMTWPDKPGSAWYTDPQFSFKKNPDHVYTSFRYQTSILAKKLGATVLPVGEYWYYAVQQHPEIELYDQDGHHSSAAGSYLAALVYYRILTGRPPEATTYVPRGVSQEHAKTIRKIVSYDL